MVAQPVLETGDGTQRVSFGGSIPLTLTNWNAYWVYIFGCSSALEHQVDTLKNSDDIGYLKSQDARILIGDINADNDGLGIIIDDDILRAYNFEENEGKDFVVNLDTGELYTSKLVSYRIESPDGLRYLNVDDVFIDIGDTNVWDSGFGLRFESDTLKAYDFDDGNSKRFEVNLSSGNVWAYRFGTISSSNVKTTGVTTNVIIDDLTMTFSGGILVDVDGGVS